MLANQNGRNVQRVLKTPPCIAVLHLNSRRALPRHCPTTWVPYKDPDFVSSDTTGPQAWDRMMHYTSMTCLCPTDHKGVACSQAQPNSEMSSNAVHPLHLHKTSSAQAPCSPAEVSQSCLQEWLLVLQGELQGHIKAQANAQTVPQLLRMPEHTRC